MYNPDLDDNADSFFSPLQYLFLSSNVKFSCSCSYPILPVLQALSLCINGISSIPILQKICGSSLIDTVVDIYFFPEDLRLCSEDKGCQFIPILTYFWRAANIFDTKVVYLSPSIFINASTQSETFTIHSEVYFYSHAFISAQSTMLHSQLERT